MVLRVLPGRLAAHSCWCAVSCPSGTASCGGVDAQALRQVDIRQLCGAALSSCAAWHVLDHVSGLGRPSALRGAAHTMV